MSEHDLSYQDWNNWQHDCIVHTNQWPLLQDVLLGCNRPDWCYKECVWWMFKKKKKKVWEVLSSWLGVDGVWSDAVKPQMDFSPHILFRGPFYVKILLQCLFIYIMSVFTADNVNVDHCFFPEDKDCILEIVACGNFSCLLQVWKVLLLHIVANKAVTFFLCSFLSVSFVFFPSSPHFPLFLPVFSLTLKQTVGLSGISRDIFNLWHNFSCAFQSPTH